MDRKVEKILLYLDSTKTRASVQFTDGYRGVVTLADFDRPKKSKKKVEVVEETVEDKPLDKTPYDPE